MNRFAAFAAALAVSALLGACSTTEPARPGAGARSAPPAPSQPATDAPAPQGAGAATPAHVPSVPPTRIRTQRDVQQRLLDLGYDPGPVDGMAGAATRAALGDFQRDHGLRPTGRMDSPTREALSAGR